VGSDAKAALGGAAAATIADDGSGLGEAHQGGALATNFERSADQHEQRRIGLTEHDHAVAHIESNFGGAVGQVQHVDRVHPRSLAPIVT